MDEYWAARERAEALLEAAKDALERFIQVLESDPELADVPVVADRLLALATTIMVDMNARGIEAETEWASEELDRVYRAWIG